MAASACALGLANAASGCDSFEEGSSPATDAATESTSPGANDGSPTTDGGPTGVDAEAGARFCSLHTNSLFCDDFEQPGRDLATADPWTTSTTSGPQVRSLAPGNASPNALNVKGVLLQPSETRLSKIVAIVPQKTRLSMDVKIDKLEKSNDEGGNPHFGAVALVFQDGKEMVLFLNALSNNQVSGFVNTRFTDAGGVNSDFVVSAAPPSVGGGFFRLAIEFEPNSSGADSFRFYLGAAPSPVLTLNLNPPGGDNAIAVGARGASLSSDVDITIDNVLVEPF